MTLMPTFKRVRYLANARGMTITEVGLRLSKPRQASVSEIINGSSFDMARLAEIAEVLGVRIWELFDDAPWPGGVTDTRPDPEQFAPLELRAA